MVNIQGTLQARKQPLDGSDDQIKGRNGENPGHSDGAGRDVRSIRRLPAVERDVPRSRLLLHQYGRTNPISTFRSKTYAFAYPCGSEIP